MKTGHPDRFNLLIGSAALILTVILGLLFFLYSTGPAPNPHATILGLFIGRLAYLAGAALIAGAALSAGLLILHLMRVDFLPRLEQGVWAFALGLGLLSLATLALGLAGLLTARAFGPLVVIVGALGTRRLGLFVTGGRHPATGRWTLTDKAFGLVAAAAAVITLIYAFNPPIYFDALEYHLGGIARYLRSGRISYLSYNVYSNFPSNGEMLYLLPMVLTGSKFTGAILGSVLNACVAIAAVAAAFCLGKWVCSRTAGVFAAAALITSAGFFAAATGVYVEPLQTLYTILALVAAGRFLQNGATGALAAAGAFAGLAMGVKYPAAVFVAVPLAAAVLLRRGSFGRRAKNFLLFSAVALLVVSPWLVKNAVLTGNPVHPLLYRVFGGRDWSALQDARWAFAHSPKGGLAWEQWRLHVFGLLFSNESVSLLAFVFAPLAFAIRPLSKRLAFVGAFAALYLFLWFALTHRIDRFALPGLAVMGAVSGAGICALPPGWTRRIVKCAALLIAISGVFYITALYGHVLALDPSVPLFGKYDRFLADKVGGYEAWDYINRNVPPASKVLLVAEAETFYLDVDCAATTVFDRKPLDEIIEKSNGDPAAAAKAIKEAGFDYVFVNWFTFNRQQQTYAFQFEAGTVHGYSDVTSPSFFDAMVAAGRMKIVYSGGPQLRPSAVASYVLYSVE